MSITNDISRRFWNLAQKGDEESAREATFIDDIILKHHAQRLIFENLDGVRTAFDAGAGSGRFSILLAERGIRVIHFDISRPMIEKARKAAEQRGVLDKMTFVEGSIEDLSAYRDGEFDLVLSTDSPISYTYPHQEAVIGELVRIAARKIILGVSNNFGWMVYGFNPAQKARYILNENTDDPFARWTLDEALPALSTFVPDMAAIRQTYRSQFCGNLSEMAKAHDAGEAQFPPTYNFMPDELQSILERHGARAVRLSGPGALSRSVPAPVLRNIMNDAALKADFLDFCYEIDSQPWCLGMGKDNLMACAEIVRD